MGDVKPPSTVCLTCDEPLGALAIENQLSWCGSDCYHKWRERETAIHGRPNLPPDTDYSKYPRSPLSDRIEEALQEQMRFIAANREKLVKAWLAETGLQPSESVIYEQRMDNGNIRVWVERKPQGETAERHLRALVGIAAEFGDAGDDVLAALQEPLEAAQNWLEAQGE